jgi:predicted AAA+ superfamily ATPase
MIGDETRWLHYIRDTLIETTIAKDVLRVAPVQKPALLRNLFFLGCQYSAQQLSFQKMSGQLQDVGNASTLAHYLRLLESAGLLCGIMKYAGQVVRRQASSPKLLALNNALMNASGPLSLAEVRQQPDRWGRIVETAVGNHLRNASMGTRMELFYWLDRQLELDFVLRSGSRLTAIEVKSGRAPCSFPAMDAFAKHFPVTRKLLVGGTGIPVDEFLLTPPEEWL